MMDAKLNYRFDAMMLCYAMRCSAACDFCGDDDLGGDSSRIKVCACSREPLIKKCPVLLGKPSGVLQAGAALRCLGGWWMVDGASRWWRLLVPAVLVLLLLLLLADWPGERRAVLAGWLAGCEAIRTRLGWAGWLGWVWAGPSKT